MNLVCRDICFDQTLICIGNCSDDNACISQCARDETVCISRELFHGPWMNTYVIKIVHVIMNALVVVSGAVMQFASSVQIKKIIKIGISASKNMVLILVFVFTIVLMMSALLTVFQYTEIKFKNALVRFNIFLCSLTPPHRCREFF